MRNLLVIGAHPDDETFFAGTMARYIHEGARVAVLCGTRGERGATADLCTIEELPKVREQELRNSMSKIGLAPGDVFFLPYEDQKLLLAPLDQVRGEIVSVIRSVRPQVVVSFDLNGGNGHPDHLAISRFASDAIAAAADPRWYPEAGDPFSISRLLWQPLFRPWELDSTANLAKCPGVDFVIETTPYAAAKEAAIREHRTQLPGLNHLFFECGYPHSTVNVEVFRLALGPRPHRTPAPDLFEGL